MSPSDPSPRCCSLLRQISLTFGGTVVNIGNTFVDDGGVVVEVVIELAFIHKLRVFGVAGFEFDGHFEVGFGVDALVDLSEGSLIDFAYDFVVFANFFWYLRHTFK